MSAFLSGVLFGVILAGSVVVIVITSRRQTRRELRREPVEWAPEFHEPQPHVTTRILVNRRSIEL
jgi:hypothetical protein